MESDRKLVTPECAGS